MREKTRGAARPTQDACFMGSTSFEPKFELQFQVMRPTLRWTQLLSTAKPMRQFSQHNTHPILVLIATVSVKPSIMDGGPILNIHFL
jgi:hypothetical protein